MTYFSPQQPAELSVILADSDGADERGNRKSEAPPIAALLRAALSERRQTWRKGDKEFFFSVESKS